MAANLVKLTSSDEKTVEVDVAVAMESEMVKKIIEAKGINEPILLPQQLSGDILAKVVEYCKYHVESRKTSNDKPATPEDEIKAWDADFVKVDGGTLFVITAAADYLKIKNLRNLTCQALVDMVTGKTAEEIGEMFNIKKDFTPKEEAKIRRQHDEWACKMVTGKTAEEIREMFNIEK